MTTVRFRLSPFHLMFRFFQSYPEWSELDQNLEQMITLAAKSLSQYDIAHDKNLADFISRQPEEVKKVLNDISDKSKVERDALESSNAALTKARTELQKLKPYHDKYQEEVKNANAIYAQATKSDNNHKALSEKLNQVRAKSGEDSPEYAAAQEKVYQALKQKEADALSKQQKEEAMVSITQNYKEQYFNCVLTAIQIIAEAREESYKKRMAVGEQIFMLASDFVEPDDPSIAILEEELHRLENLAIE